MTILLLYLGGVLAVRADLHQGRGLGGRGLGAGQSYGSSRQTAIPGIHLTQDLDGLFWCQQDLRRPTSKPGILTACILRSFGSDSLGSCLYIQGLHPFKQRS